MSDRLIFWIAMTMIASGVGLVVGSGFVMLQERAGRGEMFKLHRPVEARP